MHDLHVCGEADMWEHDYDVYTLIRQNGCLSVNSFYLILHYHLSNRGWELIEEEEKWSK